MVNLARVEPGTAEGGPEKPMDMEAREKAKREKHRCKRQVRKGEVCKQGRRSWGIGKSGEACEAPREAWW